MNNLLKIVYKHVSIRFSFFLQKCVQKAFAHPLFIFFGFYRIFITLQNRKHSQKYTIIKPMFYTQ